MFKANLGIALIAAMLSVSPGALPTQDSGTNSVGSAVPAWAHSIGGNSNGNLVTIPVTNATVNINVSSAATSVLITHSGTTSTYITHIHIISAGTTTATLEYGTGSLCASSTTTLDGPLSMLNVSGYTAGSGVGAVMIVPSGQDLCIVNSQAIQVGGAISYSQF